MTLNRSIHLPNDSTGEHCSVISAYKKTQNTSNILRISKYNYVIGTCIILIIRFVAYNHNSEAYNYYYHIVMQNLLRTLNDCEVGSCGGRIRDLAEEGLASVTAPTDAWVQGEPPQEGHAHLRCHLLCTPRSGREDLRLILREKKDHDFSTCTAILYLYTCLAFWTYKSTHVFDDSQNWQIDLPTKVDFLSNIHQSHLLFKDTLNGIIYQT